MRITLFIITLLISACSDKGKSSEAPNPYRYPDQLNAILDTIWKTEQEPIRMRDSLIDIYGAESTQAEVYQNIYRKNHAVNIKRVHALLEDGWPDTTVIDEQRNWTICNVLQHADMETREHYLPLMKEAVLDGKLEARFLVRAEDRLRTDQGELQIYGGQMKFYPETQSFNLWPVYDPENIDKRRAEIGLEPIAVFLKSRFDFEWDLEEQIRRSEEFEKSSQQSDF